MWTGGSCAKNGPYSLPGTVCFVALASSCVSGTADDLATHGDGIPSDTAAVSIVDSICDGSSSVTLRFTFVEGEPPAATYDPVMSRHGKRFFAVDGSCTFYAYDGGSYPLGVWTPVIAGILSEVELSDISAALDLQRWLEIDSESLTGTSLTGVGSGYVFYVDGHEASCDVCNAVAADLALPAFDIISELYSAGYPNYEPGAVEVLVFELLNIVDYPWVTDWGSLLPVELFLRSRNDLPSNLGVVVDGSDATWFADTLLEYQARDLDIYPRRQEGIWIEEPPAYELYIGTVVPGLPEVWGAYPRIR